jgi:hypothetical protein
MAARPGVHLMSEALIWEPESPVTPATAARRKSAGAIRDRLVMALIIVLCVTVTAAWGAIWLIWS